MKRFHLIRRRRTIYRTVVLGFAAAAVAPASALAALAPEASSVRSATSGYGEIPALVSPAKAGTTGYGQVAHGVSAAKAGTTGYGGVAGPPREVPVGAPIVSQPATDWSRVALVSSLGLATMLGLFLVAASRRGSRVAHS